MKFTIVFLLLLSITLSYRKRSMLRTQVIDTKDCTIRLILDAGSSGTGGALALQHGDAIHNLDIKVKRPNDKNFRDKKTKPEDFYKAELDKLKPPNRSKVESILENNLKLSNITYKKSTSILWADAAKVHITKFYSSEDVSKNSGAADEPEFGSVYINKKLED
jgi:hypothetical protein